MYCTWWPIIMIYYYAFIFHIIVMRMRDGEWETGSNRQVLCFSHRRATIFCQASEDVGSAVTFQAGRGSRQYYAQHHIPWYPNLNLRWFQSNPHQLNPSIAHLFNSVISTLYPYKAALPSCVRWLIASSNYRIYVSPNQPKSYCYVHQVSYLWGPMYNHS